MEGEEKIGFDNRFMRADYIYDRTISKKVRRR